MAEAQQIQADVEHAAGVLLGNGWKRSTLSRGTTVVKGASATCVRHFPCRGRARGHGASKASSPFEGLQGLQGLRSRRARRLEEGFKGASGGCTSVRKLPCRVPVPFRLNPQPNIFDNTLNPKP